MGISFTQNVYQRCKGNQDVKRRRHLDNLEQDIREHIERDTLANIERGMSFEEAQASARRKFGNVTQATEQTREVWSMVWLQQLWQDMRYGIRMLRGNPGFAAVVILTLALGIGMNTAVFSVVNTVLLRSVDYPNPDRLVWLSDYDPNLKRAIVASPDFLEWRGHSPVHYPQCASWDLQNAQCLAPRSAPPTSVH